MPLSVPYIHTEISCLVTISLAQECEGEGHEPPAFCITPSVTELEFGYPMIMNEDFNQPRKIHQEITLSKLFVK